MIYTEFKEKFLPQLNDIKSFAGRIKFANENLQGIGSGTGRIVYDIDGVRVLKLAKNTKGIAQNEAEGGAGYYRDTHHIVAQVFDSAEDNSWLLSEKAKKVTEKRIKELTGIPSLNDLFYYLRNIVEENKGRRRIFNQEPEIVEELNNNEFVQDLYEFIMNYSQEVGDMGRPSTYGEVMHDGQPSIILTDYGLNDEVYNTYYNPERKRQKYQMYELFNYGDGNDDILSDTGDQGDIRRGMWAQIPYSVSDGQGVFNEGFINFVSNRSSYPNKPISGLPVLTDNFHDCVNNIDEILGKIKNKKQFYLNLLELQNYLTKQGYYDRDQLKITEDGSSKFSTDSEMGQDGFPPYNTNDTSPMINNDLDANVAMYEDLDYNHVNGDASDDEYMITERNKSFGSGSKTVKVKKKCQIGGLGNTSVACNQGDIKNLEFGSVNENDLEVLEYFSSLVPMNEQGIMSLQDLPFKKEVEKLGGNIFSVGGAVRDEFLGKDSKDLDILITGIPMDTLEQLLGKYGGVNAVGKSFGVLKFVPKGSNEEIDVAIPRTEVATGDGGHKGFDVSSDHELPIEKDLERRDFTINAIAKDINGNIIDPYNGQEDLKNKIIRIVNPEAFSDDPLRMLRAVQFASRFGFTIEPKTTQMIKNNASRIKEIPPERILIEFDKIINKGNKLTGAFLLKQLGLTPQIFNGDGSLYVGNEWDNIKTMGEFLWFLGSHLVQDIAEFSKSKLKCDVETYKELKALQQAFHVQNNPDVITARTLAHNIYKISPKTLNSDILPESIKNAAQELLQGKYPKTINELTVNGNDLMEKGLQGKEVGDMLKSMLIQIYADKIRNNREELLSLVNDKKNTTELNEENINEEQIEYGALMLFFDIPKWEKITSLIKKEDIYEKDGEFGIENEPHTTILYGFHDNVNEEEVFDLVKKTIKLKPIGVETNKISIFESPEFDVVKFDINSETLIKLNKAMKGFPHTSTHPVYHPHMTIAYVKKGAGKKYVVELNEKLKITGNELVFSTKKEKRSKLLLNEKQEQYEGYIFHGNSKQHTWDINGEKVTVNFFMKEYDEWNNQGGKRGYDVPSKESVLEFLQNNYEDESVDKKLNDDLYNALTDRELLKEESMKKIQYSAVVLDDKSRTSLINVFKPMIPESWEVIAHHMTINMGPIDIKYRDFLGKEAKLNVISYAIDDLVMAVGVKGFGTLNKIPHITIAVNRKDGGKPVLSNKLTDWKPLGFPLTLTGKVEEL